MTVHFNVHMDPAKGETMPEELTDVILGEILYAQNNTDAVLSDVVIDEESLDIQGKTGNGSPRSLQPTQWSLHTFLGNGAVIRPAEFSL